MSAMKWFRLYSEFCHDPKLATFTKAERYDIIHLFCIASESLNRGSIDLDPKDLAAVLKITLPKYMAFEEELGRKGIAIRSNMSLDMMNWEKRQYEKPSATPKSVSERVRDHREKQRNAKNVTCNAQETPVKQCGNDTDTEADTDTETKHPPKPPKDRAGDPYCTDYDAALLEEYREVIRVHPHWESALAARTPENCNSPLRYQSKIWRDWVAVPQFAPKPPPPPTDGELRSEIMREAQRQHRKSPDESIAEYTNRINPIMVKMLEERKAQVRAMYPPAGSGSGSGSGSGPGPANASRQGMVN